MDSKEVKMVWVKVKATGKTIQIAKSYADKNPRLVEVVEQAPEPVAPIRELLEKPTKEVSEAIGAPTDEATPELNHMKLPELRAYAKANGIEISGKSKLVIIEQIEASWQK